jgi:hypothetical protein
VPPSRVLDEIRTLDPRRDAQRIARLSAGVDFPWDTRRAYELALLKTFAVPSSSRLLVRTGRFLARTAERHDATVTIVATLGLHGYDSPEGRAALRAMNLAHRAYAIPADEYRYTLSLFVLEPLRWNARFGWRPLDPVEREAGFHFWREVGRRMAIEDLPDELGAMEAESRAFEERRVGYDPANRRLLDASLDLTLARTLPLPLRPAGRPVGRRALATLLEPRFLGAFGLASPSPVERAAVRTALRTRSAVVSKLPRRTRPVGVPRLAEAPDLDTLRGTAAGDRAAGSEARPGA